MCLTVLHTVLPVELLSNITNGHPGGGHFGSTQGGIRLVFYQGRLGQK